MDRRLMVDLSVSYSDADVDFLKGERKWFATRSQEEAERTCRKLYQRKVKAITLVIDHIEGREPGRFPNELIDDIRSAFVSAQTRTSHAAMYEAALSEH